MTLWAIGVAQCLNRILWLLRNGRHRGVAIGLISVPSQLLRHRRYRHRLSVRAIWSYLKLRRLAIPIAGQRGQRLRCEPLAP
jgi:hypothetical protein